MRRAAPRRAALLDRQLPTVAAALARSVRTGATLGVALDDVATGIGAPVQQDLQQVLWSVASGSTLDAALARWQRARQNGSIDLLVAACRFGHAEGGDLAAALDGAAVSLLDAVEVADEARAQSSQARSSATVLVLLPLLGAVGFSLLDPGVADTLFTTPPGWICLGTGLSLDAIGAWALSRLVRSALA